MIEQFDNWADKLFYQLCQSQNWKAERIKTSDLRTPDYLVQIEDNQFIAEVKELEASDNDKKVINENSTHYSFIPGEKVRAKIKDSSKQLRFGLETYKVPTLLALFDRDYAGYLSPDCVRAAMYGEMTLHISKNEKEASALLHEKNAQMREDKHTHISAIAVIRPLAPNKTAIEVHHNPYAILSFPTDFFGKENVYEFRYQINRE